MSDRLTYQLLSTGLVLGADVRAYLDTKIGHIEKFLPPGPARANVELGRTTRHHRHGDIYRAEMTLSVPGAEFRAVAEHDDLMAALDTVKDEIIAELKKRAGRQETLVRRGGRSLKSFLRGINPWH